jgi:hypothetical protein
VLIGNNEKAEFNTEEFLSYNSCLENFTIIRKNPDYEEEEEPVKK